MGKFKSSSSAKQDKKKKGPKGKKARAKAKLDRQWGIATPIANSSKDKKVVKSVKEKSDRARIREELDDSNTSNNLSNIDSTTTSATAVDDDVLLSDDDEDMNHDNNNKHSIGITSQPYIKLLETIQHQQTVLGIDNYNDYDDGTACRRSEEFEDAPDVMPIFDPRDTIQQQTINNSNDNSNNHSSFTQRFVIQVSSLPTDNQPDYSVSSTLQLRNKKQHRGTSNNMNNATTTKAVQYYDYLPIQDNTNICIQLATTNTDIDTIVSWSYRNYQHHWIANSNQRNNKSGKAAIVTKKEIQRVTEMCCQNNNMHKNKKNFYRSCQYLIPILTLPAITTYADVCITTDGTHYGNVDDDDVDNKDDSNTADIQQQSILQRLEQMYIATATHIVNHVLCSRYNIHTNNRKISKILQRQQQKKVKESEVTKNNNNDNDDDLENESVHDDVEVVQNNTNDNDDWKRDQGYTRPTILILLPTRNCCYDYVQTLLSLLNDINHENENNKVEDIGSSVENMDRFVVEYGPIPKDNKSIPKSANNEDDEEEESDHRQQVLRRKGILWNELFGDHRNDDDDFKIGVQINVINKKKNKTSISPHQTENDSSSFQGSIKLYSDFYRSDIIIASPLGLKMAVTNKQVGDDDDDANNGDDSKSTRHDIDFLSSIEICMIGRGEVLLQQNWDHVTDVLQQLNHIPKTTKNIDFSRVRPYYLSEQAALWKQLILFSTHSDPIFTSCIKRYGTNQNGTITIRRQYNIEESSLYSVRLPITKQVFQRVTTTSSFINAGQDRVQYFCKYVWPEIEKNRQKHTLIFIPSYFDYVMLRNILLQRKTDGIAMVDYVCVTEYSRISEVSRGRARFLQGRKEVMLYTGRAHYFLRHAIKGARHLIFLGLPEQASFYSEHVNRLNEGIPSSSTDDNMHDDEMRNNSTCLAIYTKYDSYALERIVGTENCRRMVTGEKSTHYFSS